MTYNLTPRELATEVRLAIETSGESYQLGIKCPYGIELNQFTWFDVSDEYSDKFTFNFFSPREALAPIPIEGEPIHRLNALECSTSMCFAGWTALVAGRKGYTPQSKDWVDMVVELYDIGQDTAEDLLSEHCPESVIWDVITDISRGNFDEANMHDYFDAQ